MNNLVGQQIGNYQLLRLLGYGGFAKVYLGEHIYLQTQAAIKVISTPLPQVDQQSYLQEGRLQVSLDHPYILHIRDCGIEQDLPFLVMDYAPGGTLRQRHPRGTQVPLQQVITYLSYIAPALQYAHDRRLIHRDLKPENMLIGQNGEVLLSDFGIAILAATISAAPEPQMRYNVAGTATYMAPEQIKGHPVYASDQYALGVIVYEWLAGSPPFEGSFLERTAKHLHTSPPPLNEKGVTLPPPVEAIIMRTLEKDPVQRFSSVQEFALTLTNAISQSSISSSSPYSTSPRQSFTAPNSTIPSIPPSTVLQPKSETLGVRITQRRRFRIDRSMLLIGLALLVLLGTLGLFNFTKNNQITSSHFPRKATVPQAELSATPTIPQAVPSATTTVLQAVPSATPTIPPAVPSVTPTTTTSDNTYMQATSGQPVLNDPLSDNSSGNGWAEGTDCVFSGGTYHVKSEQQNTFTVCSAQPTFSNFAFQVQMTILNGDFGGLIFRTSQQDPFGYRFAFRSQLVPSYSGDLVYGNQLLATFTTAKANLNQTYLLTAIARGNTLSLYIDKKLVMSVSDSNASVGGIGLMAGKFDNTADVAFSNAQVWQL